MSGINLISNPLWNCPEPRLKMTNILAKPDTKKMSAKQELIKQQKMVNTSTKVPVEHDTVKLPFVVPAIERSKVNLPVADFRYYNNEPVYHRTTLPFTTYRKPRPLTVWHGLLFSLILIVGTILGAFAGYGIYKLFQ